MVFMITKYTERDRDTIKFEIKKVVELYKTTLIAVYPNYSVSHNQKEL
jgi:hypothetical protein